MVALKSTWLQMLARKMGRRSFMDIPYVRKEEEATYIISKYQKKGSYDAIRNEVLLSINTFLRQRFDDTDFADLAAIKNLPSAKEKDLRKLHAAIVPDQSLADFVQSCLEVGQMTELNNSDPRLLLKAIIGDKSTKSLHLALARIIAAKPQLADVERLISTYNKIKTDGRSSISPETLCKCIFIAINMPDLASFDFRSPAKLWLEKNEDVSIMPLKRLRSKIGSRECLKAQECKKKAPRKIAAKHLNVFLLNKVRPRQTFNFKCRPHPTFKNVHL